MPGPNKLIIQWEDVAAFHRFTTDEFHNVQIHMRNGSLIYIIPPKAIADEMENDYESVVFDTTVSEWPNKYIWEE